MTQQAQPTNVLPASILLVAIASGSLLLIEEPFKSGRHSETATTTTLVTPSAQIVDARLWQDPLPLIRSDWRRILSQIDETELESAGDNPEAGDAPLTLPNDELPWLISDFRAYLARTAERHAESGCERQRPRLLVLPMLVPGSNYDNDIEVRRRSRYAMISALTSSQYAPANGQKLGYFLAPRAGPFLRANEGSSKNAAVWRQPVIVGFEWFEQQRHSVKRYRCGDPLLKWDTVVALWISEADLQPDPLARVDALLTYLTSEVLHLESEVDPIVALKAVGPSSSAVLADIYDEVQRHSGDSAAAIPTLSDDNRRFTAAADAFTVDCALRLSLRPYNDACSPPGDTVTADVTADLPLTAIDQYEVYPQPGGLYFEGPEFASDMLVLSLDSYLYGGLPDGLNTSRLRECARNIVQAQFGTGPEAPMSSIEVFGQAESCLTDPALNKVIDADADWRSVVADIWLSKTKWQLLNPTLDIQLQDASERLRIDNAELIASLVEDANYYLDWGVPPRSDIGGIFECLDPVMDIDDRDSWLSSAESCLAANLPVDRTNEFDDDWAASIALAWFENNSHILLESEPVSERVISPASRESMTVLNMVEFLSPRSTMPLALIARTDVGAQEQVPATKGAGVPRKQIRNDSDFLGVINSAGIPLKNFRSTIARDQLTAAVLVEELWRRKVFSNDRDDIAILFELDSDYGRALPILIECYVQQILASKEEQSRTSLFELAKWFGQQSPITVLDLGCPFTGERRGSANTVHSFGYFAGIDGLELPGTDAADRPDDAAAGTDDDAASGAQSILELPADLELPVGASQFDYLRRLARVVQQKDEELHDDSNSAGLRAVGIFGTDIYDKQLILQALHRALPNTVFFTTDLDARLAHPGQYEWNRNLIVASAYGLGLSPHAFVRDVGSAALGYESEAFSQSDTDFTSYLSDTATQSVEIGVPPLRGVYQTALFLTTKLALLESVDEEAEFFGRPFEPPLPRLFEIGRYGEVDITPVPPELARPSCNGDMSKGRENRLQYTAIDGCLHGNLGWTQYRSADFDRLLVNAAILMSPILLLTFVWGRHWFLVDRVSQSIEWGAYRAATVFGVTSVLVILACLISWRDPAAEPWLLFDGISGIPALVLRTIALVYSIIIGIIAFGRFRQNNFNLATRFGLDTDIADAWPLRPPVAWPGLHTWMKHDWSTVSWIRQINDDSRHGQRPVKAANEIWEKYRTLGHPVARLLRSAPHAIVVCFVVLYWYLAGMHEHALMRGWIVTFDLWLTSITGVTVIFVIFLSADAMHLCQAFIRALARYDVIWPPMKDDPTFKSMGLDEKVYCRVRCVDMIIYRTEMITPTIIMPFALIFFLLLARTDLFDNWEWSAPLVLVYVALSAFLLVRALLMQREAEQARNRIVMRLRRRKNAMLDEYQGKDMELEKHLEQADSIIEYVLNVRRGAFVPWLQHPIVQAILLPFTGIGAIAILDALL